MGNHDRLLLPLLQNRLLQGCYKVVVFLYYVHVLYSAVFYVHCTCIIFVIILQVVLKNEYDDLCVQQKAIENETVKTLTLNNSNKVCTCVIM